MDDSTNTVDNNTSKISTDSPHMNNHHFGGGAAGGDDYAYKNEISLSIDDGSNASNASTNVVPTPSPRHNNSNGNSNHTEIDMPNGDEKLIKKSNGTHSEAKMGFDNPAYDAEYGDQNPGRPLSSFGHNKVNDTTLGLNSPNGKSQTSAVTALNGSAAAANASMNEKPLTGNYPNDFYYPQSNFNNILK